MLATAPPQTLKRPNPGLGGHFDLLVIDEAPWFNLVPNEPYRVPLEWFSPEWWAAQTSSGNEHQERSATEALTKLRSIFARLPRGEIEAAEFAAAVLRSDLQAVRRNIWKFKTNLRGLVKPGSNLLQLNEAIKSVTSGNRRVLAVVKALETIELHISGKLAPSGVALEEDDKGIRYLRLRRRHEIDQAWLSAPTLYLDAADVSAIDIAKAWLPDLTLKVDARAAAPYMSVTQVVDSQMGYRKFLARGNDDERIALANRERMAGVIGNLGAEGLVICPKEVRLAWEKAASLPTGWTAWNFEAIRGRDEARETPNLVIVSRPLPGPVEVEQMAETIFGRRLEKIPDGGWYPLHAVGRLMTDGTGRRALAYRHPDPLVEAVRFAVCEGELLQAVGRGRGVRRTAETPLRVLIVTNVPIPVAVDQLTAWGDLCAIGPFDLLLENGVVPLDHAGIAAALPGQFAGAARVKDWLQYHADARSVFKGIAKSAGDLGQVAKSDFSGILHRDSNMDDSAKLTAFRYRRAGSQQRALVLVDSEMHADSRAAVEAVLGPVELLVRVEKAQPRRRAPRREGSLDAVSQSALDQLFGLGGPDTTSLRRFGSRSAQ
jgi:hypothetical protein